MIAYETARAIPCGMALLPNRRSGWGGDVRPLWGKIARLSNGYCVHARIWMIFDHCPKKLSHKGIMKPSVFRVRICFAASRLLLVQ